MRRTVALVQSTVGRKAVIAITGVALFGFVIAHMLGNLQIYLGPERLNDYAATLKHSPILLWSARLGLLVAVVLHIGFSIALASKNADARPHDYARRSPQVTSYAARTMVWSGPLLFVFIVYHLLHLTFGFSPTHHFSPTDVYANVVTGFHVWWLAAFYVFAQCLLGLHLYHGAWSFASSLGLEHPRFDRARRTLATSLAAIVVVGNVSIPVAVYTGLIGGPSPAPDVVIEASNP